MRSDVICRVWYDNLVWGLNELVELGLVSHAKVLSWASRRQDAQERYTMLLLRIFFHMTHALLEHWQRCLVVANAPIRRDYPMQS